MEVGEESKINTPLSAETWERIIQDDINQLEEPSKKYSLMKVITIFGALISTLGISQITGLFHGFQSLSLTWWDMNLVFAIIIEGIFLVHISIILWILIFDRVESNDEDIDEYSNDMPKDIFRAMGYVYGIAAGFIIVIMVTELFQIGFSPSLFYGCLRMLIFIIFFIIFFTSSTFYLFFGLEEKESSLTGNDPNVDVKTDIIIAFTSLFTLAFKGFLIMVVLLYIGFSILFAYSFYYGPPPTINLFNGIVLAIFVGIPMVLLIVTAIMKENIKSYEKKIDDLESLQMCLRLGLLDLNKIADYYHFTDDEIIKEVIKKYEQMNEGRS